MLPRVCVIGAGCSGFTTVKRLRDDGIPYDCFEESDDVGGNWYYRNPNGRSACYESLHIDTSTTRLQFAEYPAPADWPDFPHHTLIHQYFRDYVDHFNLRETITFNTRVDSATRAEDGTWRVALSTGEVRDYDVLIVANGHHWDPRIPEYPGEFTGIQLHSHDYRSPFDPIDMRGKNIVVVGMGNSGMDLASELSHRWIANRLWISARRGVWVLAKYRGGKPADKLMMPPWMPRKLALRIARKKIRESIGEMENYGLPKPDHEPLSAHPSVSADLLVKAGSGDITCVPEIKAFEGNKVRFIDDTSVDADVVIFATGYNMRFPFFDDPDLQPDSSHRFPLFKRMMKPGIGNLFFMGLAQSSPTIVNLAEQQSRLVAAYLTGRYALPDVERMRAIITADDNASLAQYYQVPRHTIQIDFARYVRDLNRELQAGAKRAAKLGNPLPVPAKAPASPTAGL